MLVKEKFFNIFFFFIKTIKKVKERKFKDIFEKSFLSGSARFPGWSVVGFLKESKEAVVAGESGWR